MEYSEDRSKDCRRVPDDRREVIKIVRDIVLKHLPEGYEEVMQYNMISYVVPLSKYLVTYNKQPLALLSIWNQKNHMGINSTSISNIGFSNIFEK